jgi:hypothetical protein
MVEACRDNRYKFVTSKNDLKSEGRAEITHSYLMLYLYPCP